MNRGIFKSLLAGAACAALFAASAHAQNFNIPGGDLKSALESYMKQSGIALMYPEDEVSGVHTKGVTGSLSSDEALSRLLKGTGLTTQRGPSGAIGIVQGATQSSLVEPLHLAQAVTPPRTSVETVTVTSSKLGGADVQSIPIAITALSQEQLTATQTAGGPDLIKQVPNMTFTKTNFTGYSIQLRGIGTQAISVTTDPAVAVAFNDTPFIRNHFFEQEFYDVSQVEVLRGPQGTLYGRNATAGVVNLTSAPPSNQFEAMASAELGNYHQRRFEGMVNLPIVDDRLDIRLAGEWTKRQGYSFNELTSQRIDGRDLWSGRLSIAWKPIENLRTTFIWEHFSENDDRIRSSKQLCKTAPIPETVLGVPVPGPGYGANANTNSGGYFSQGCLPVSLYSPEAFEVPNGFSLPYVSAGYYGDILNQGVDPYASTTQSRNLRVIESSIDPAYRVKNDLVELNTDYSVSQSLTVTSQTAFNHDFLYSTQDYNRFNTSPGIFSPYRYCGPPPNGDPNQGICDSRKVDLGLFSPDGVFCDPQLGCSNRLVAQDLSTEHAWQLSQEFRVSSNFDGPLNFNLGGNYLHYETEENYYVFINALTAFSYWEGDLPAIQTRVGPWIPGVTDGHQCLSGMYNGHGGFQYSDLTGGLPPPGVSSCTYIDPNQLGHLNDQGHNYFLSKNPYVLNSYAAFGEANYKIKDDLKLVGGVRWTGDRKHFTLIPSELTTTGYGYPSLGVVDRQWDEVTGRAVLNWTPNVEFTDQTLVYGSYAHGYKAGGANPPGAVLIAFGTGQVQNPIHPLTFKPEFIDAFELGSKNTLLDGALTLNVSGFYYDYTDYQISEIVDRTSINLNFSAKVKGAEVEGTWEPVPGLRFNFSGGWEKTSIDRGQKAVDLMDRTAGTPGWMVFKSFIGQASNCILPDYVIAASIVNQQINPLGSSPGSVVELCGEAYGAHLDPVTALPFVPGSPDPVPSLTYTGPSSITEYPGFDPLTAPNNGQGFDKDLSGKELPNAPPLTVSVGGQYTIPISSNWAGTLRSDFYWQDYSWARVFNDNPYDRIRGYANLNLTLIFTSQSGWQVMLYDKNVFNTTAITGSFLNSDDSGLTTNVFLTDPKLIGVRVTKNW